MTITITFVSLTKSHLTTLQSTLKPHKNYDFKFSNTSIDSIEDLNYDAVISPANSFGGLKGGIDMRYYMNLGREKLQSHVFDVINERHYGELLVGEYSPINLKPFVRGPNVPKFLILCPTMSIPMTVQGTRNAYYYTRAMLRAIKILNLAGKKITNVLCPIPCVGVGAMNIKIAAAQMETAFAAFEGKGLIFAIHGVDPETYTEYGDSFDQNMKLAYLQMINGRS